MTRPGGAARGVAAPRPEPHAGAAHGYVEPSGPSRHRDAGDLTSAGAGTHVETDARPSVTAPPGVRPSGQGERAAHSEPNARAVYADAFPDVAAAPDVSRPAFSALPMLLSPSGPDAAAPSVASSLARQGALSEPLSPDDDLDALADKIKLILDEQARRHGIDV